WDDDQHTFRRDVHTEYWRLIVGDMDRLLEIDHPVVRGSAAQQVLRSLPDEVPSKVGQAKQERARVMKKSKD
ncbi:MAG: hypothetical protein ACRYFY_22550, partial [Janthinobacterium lividum]